MPWIYSTWYRDYCKSDISLAQYSIGTEQNIDTLVRSFFFIGISKNSQLTILKLPKTLQGLKKSFNELQLVSGVY